MIYFKDAARALVQLAEAPQQNINMVNYVIAGPTPTPSAGELAELVRAWGADRLQARSSATSYPPALAT